MIWPIIVSDGTTSRTQASMQGDEYSAITDRLNAGAEIPSVEPSLLKNLWEAFSSIPRERRRTTALGFDPIARGDPNRFPPNPEQHIAMLVRCSLLEALIDRGVLDECMGDESLLNKVFAAAASFPFNKDDLGEALAQWLLRESPPEVAEKAIAEMRQAGCDHDHPNVCNKFIEWMRDHC